MKYERFIDKLKKINSVFRVTIPSTIVRKLKLKEGQDIRVSVRKIDDGDKK